jgi:hypothetical protein
MRRVGAALAVTLLTGGTALTATAADAHDGFYDVPKNVSKYRPGQVIAARQIDAKAYDISLPATSWQLKFRTTDFRGRPTATLTTVMVPTAAWTGKGPRPLVSYQTAEDGVDQHCAPSRAIKDGHSAGFSGSYSETGVMAEMLFKGWAVAAPDYEGPRSEFLIAGTSGKGVLDGLRAARSFKPAGLAKAPLGVWGYSGGSFASVVAAQLQPRYAPELKLTGLALGGLVGNLRDSINAFSGSIGGGVIPMGINGFLRAYPELNIAQNLNASGKAKVIESSKDCLFEAAPRYPFLKIADIEATPGGFYSPKVVKMLAENSPINIKGVPKVATFWYHASGDEFAPFAPAHALIQRFCKAGTVVQATIRPVGEHLTEVAVGASGAMDFLAARFAGSTPVNSCASLG